MRRSRVLVAVRRGLADFEGRPALVVSALSGGADSVALLHALVQATRGSAHRVVAAHLDHGLRQDSPDDAAFCAELCGRLGVALVTARADVPARVRERRESIEQAARAERYAFLRRVKDETGASVIALAHTRDDQAETVLLRLLRGAGSLGLGAMRPRAGDLWRPLLDVSRADVRAHLRGADLAWREDPSNGDLDLARNRVRGELIPYLERRFNPQVTQALARAAGLLADEADALARRADDVYVHAAADGLSRRVLRESPPAVARAVLRRALADAGGLADVGTVHVERLLRLACDPASSGRRLPLPGGREALVRFDRLVIAPRSDAAVAFAAPLDVPGSVRLPDGRTLAARAASGPPRVAPDDAVVPAPALPLEVRTRRPGDRVRAHGRDVSLKRFLLDRRVPADLRPGLPLVAAGHHVVWIPGFSSDAEAVPGRVFVHLRLTPETRA